jgi:hypothetical protein
MQLLYGNELKKENSSKCFQMFLQDADPQYCADGVDTYWPGMAKAIFGYSETPVDICSAGGICKKNGR